MDHKVIAETLRRLLPVLEGVSLEHIRTHPSGYATITLRIAHPASVARLACWAVNINRRSDTGTARWFGQAVRVAAADEPPLAPLREAPHLF